MNMVEMFKKLKLKKEAKRIMLNFVTGKMSTIDFWKEYKNNEIIQNILKNDKKRKKTIRSYDSETGCIYYSSGAFLDSVSIFNADTMLKTADIYNLYHRVVIFNVVKRYFASRKRKINYNNYDVKEYDFLCEMIPNWIETPDIEVMQKLFNEAPKSLTKEQKVLWCKNKFIEKYKFISKLPDWVQYPDWPVVNDKPLVFMYQKEDKNDDRLILYYFYNEKEDKEVVIKQYM